MKIKIRFTICIIAGLTLNSFAQTSVPGGNVSGTWTLANSPYNIQGSIQITNGSTLTIEPGVTVNFQGTYKLLVLGRLLAVGTVTDTITFTAANTANGWRSIRFDNTASANDSSEIKFCKLQYGKATGAYPDDSGGALYFDNFSKAVIANCRIADCVANTSGGGIYCNASSPRISDNTISGNTATYGQGGGIFSNQSSSRISGNSITGNEVSPSSVTGYGGGIYCSGGNEVIDNNIVSDNTASISGGGIYCTTNSSVISNNIISGNSTPGSGGGICSDANATPYILGNTIYNNTANRGGGIHTTGTSPYMISNNTISNNIAQLSQGNDGQGGGVYCLFGSPIFSNNTITNNSITTTPGFGGAFYCNNSSPQLTNNTIANNSAFIGGALYCTNNSNPISLNNIFWGNFGNMAGNTLYAFDELSDPGFTYSDVQYGSGGFEMNGNFYTGTYQNNITTNPMFVAPSGGSGNVYDGVTADWSLQSGSPCINTGNPVGSYPSTDKAGNPRVVNAIIDMGAYESQTITDVGQNDVQAMFSVYPNPASRSLVISFQSSLNANLDLEIINALGEQVFQISDIENQKLSIDVSEFASGIYFVKIKDGTKTHSRKILVE